MSYLLVVVVVLVLVLVVDERGTSIRVSSNTALVSDMMISDFV